MPIPSSRKFGAVLSSRRGEELEGQQPGAPTISAGCDLRRVDAHRSDEDRRRKASDRAGLGDEVQYPWSLRLIAGKARPRHHAQATNANEDFKKLPGPPGGNRAGKERRSWLYRLECRRGASAKKNKISRRWARRGTRPQRQATSPPPRPISSARSVRKRARRSTARRAGAPISARRALT